MTDSRQHVRDGHEETSPLLELLDRLRRDELDLSAAAAEIAKLTAPSAVVDGATVDVDRARRCGFPEVVFCEGKSPEAVVAIFAELTARHGTAYGTRADQAHAAAVVARWPDAVHVDAARTLRLGSLPETPGARVAVVTAGTSDLPVAEEARETLSWMGCEVDFVVDVGVAGPHRLLDRLERITGADAVVVVAGMEGALPSVVGGWVDCPVFAVPTSVGYGSHLGGMVPLLAMLNGCAANVAVVNVDAGFKGGYLAGLVATRAHRPPPIARPDER